MITVKQANKKTFWTWMVGLIVAIILELGSVVLILNSTFAFISNDSIIKAIVGAILGFLLVFTVSFLVSVFKDYNESENEHDWGFMYNNLEAKINSQLKDAIEEINEKYELIFNEFLEQRKFLENGSKIKGAESFISDQIGEIEKRIYATRMRKVEELEYAFAKFGINSKDKEANSV